MSTIPADVVRTVIQEHLVETFEHINHLYLDEGTSLFETLAAVSAETASQAASPRVGTLAAQVDHTGYYLEILTAHLRAGGDDPAVKGDWAAAWRTTTVTDAEWTALVDRLRTRYREVSELLASTDDWNEDMLAGFISIVVHSAHHLGEIRQALGVIPQADAAG